MNVTIWVLQILLALAFLAAGLTKLTQPRQKLATNMGWVEDFSDPACGPSAPLRSWGPLGCCCQHSPEWPPCSSPSPPLAWPC